LSVAANRSIVRIRNPQLDFVLRASVEIAGGTSEHCYILSDSRFPFSAETLMPDPCELRLTDYIRDIPDFPKPGILFRDITPLLGTPAALRQAVIRLADHYRHAGIDVVAAAEARGFIFAAPLAMELDVGFVPVRKPGKLPFDTHAFHYDLEYGTDTLEVHVDGISPGQNVLVVDDLLATGGTVEACCRLVEMCGATVAGCAFVIELVGLNGADRIKHYHPYSLIKYD
jgi:adenine phosphoribosyltransferase